MNGKKYYQDEANFILHMVNEVEQKYCKSLIINWEYQKLYELSIKSDLC